MSSTPNPWMQHTVLAVDDSKVQRAHMVDLLRQLGFGAILEAGDGNEALRVLEQHGAAVFLVLTDLEMPGMDGIELTRRLAERQLTQNLIVASARDPRLLEIIENMGLEDASLGLLGTVLKPVKLDDLVQLLDRIGHTSMTRAKALDNKPTNLLEIEAALERGEFIPYYQPKISMHSGFIKGMEALARWNHPTQGVLSPLYFIPGMEGTPLMVPFTLAIVEQVLQQLAEWQHAGLPALTVSVNLSADDLADRDFVDKLAALVQKHGITPQSLIWEVTETMVMNHLSQSLANLGRLRLMGFGLAMDDYGIGYSSMQQLSRCPFTELKIDRVFVDGASKRPNRHVILESSIELGRRLGVTTVAEGVETVADWNLLRELGCDLAQGYLVAKPMPASEMIGWIKNNRVRLRALATDTSETLHSTPPAQ
jgi:EAL domain-containing protein (putative c-di-GMP-specific phosphodiesterase class I)/AmiR/NasT family two-component response regulator